MYPRAAPPLLISVRRRAEPLDICTAQITCLPEIARLLAAMPAAGKFKADCDANLRFRVCVPKTYTRT